VKPINGIQPVQVRSGQSRSGQAGSACCHSPGDWRVRSVHSEKAGREDSAPTSVVVAMPTLLTKRKAASAPPLCKGSAGSPESLARGMLSSGFPANPGELSASRARWACVPPNPKRTGSPGARGSLHGKRMNPRREKPVAKGNRRWQRRVDEQSYEPMVPLKVENRRAPVKGRPRYPLEGRGEQVDVSMQCYMHGT